MKRQDDGGGIMKNEPNVVSLRTKAGSQEQCAAVAAEGFAYGQMLRRFEQITCYEKAYIKVCAHLSKFYLPREHYASIDVEDIFIDNALCGVLDE